MYYLAPINGPDAMDVVDNDLGHAPWQVLLRLGVDITFMVVGGAIFALFWIKTAGLDSKGCRPADPVIRHVHSLATAGIRRYWKSTLTGISPVSRLSVVSSLVYSV
jgi:hypothetical protein